MTDDELEAMFRTSLAGHADGVVDSGDRVATAHAGVRRRRRISAAVAVAAAVVILAPAAVVAVTLGQASTNAAGPPPSSWRVESYNGIELRVPAAWGWGVVAWDGCIGEVEHQPYVGRPVGERGESPTCIGVQYDAHVWFDSPLPVGRSDTARTVRVEGLTPFNITVSERDPALRESILGSIRSVERDGNGCSVRPSLSVSPSAIPTETTFTSMSVCLYYKRDLEDRGYLYYSTRVGSSAASHAVSLIEASRYPPNSGACLGLTVVAPGFSLLTLVNWSSDGTLQYSVNPYVCGGQVEYVGDGRSHPVTKASARLWAVAGVPLYAGRAAGANDLAQYLPSP